MECDSAIKRNEGRIHTTMWMILKALCQVKEANTKGHILGDSIYMKYSK